MENLVQSAEHGVIVVTFGSNVKYLPDRLIIKMVNAFGRRKELFLMRFVIHCCIVTMKIQIFESVMASFHSFWENACTLQKVQSLDFYSSISRFAGKLTDKDFKMPSNVKFMSWLPQNDLLAHNKTKLFITHGGMYGKVVFIFFHRSIFIIWTRIYL